MSIFLAEMIGSMFLLVFGFGAGASSRLQHSLGKGGGFLMEGLSWGIGLALGIMAASALGSQGHVNPAVTIAMVTAGILPAAEAPTYFMGQIAGGILSGIIVWLLYLPHWSATEDKDVKLSCFAMVPAIRNLPANFIAELLSFFIFIVGVFVIGKVVFPVSAIACAFVTGLWLTAAICATGGQIGCGYGIDLGTRIAHQILPISGKRDSDWVYALVPVVGPAIGGFAAALAALQLGLV